MPSRLPSNFNSADKRLKVSLPDRENIDPQLREAFMQTLRDLYREDAEVFERLDRAMQKPPRPASGAFFSAEFFATLHLFRQDLSAISRRGVRRFHLLVRRTLRFRLAPRSGASKLTK